MTSEGGKGKAGSAAAAMQEGFRPYAPRNTKAGESAGAAPTATAETESPPGGAGTTTHLSAGPPELQQAQHHEHQGGGPEQDYDRNRSVSSVPRGMPPLGTLPGMFTAGFPPGPQQHLLAQLPWFATMQNTAQLAATSDTAAAAAASMQHGRGLSFPVEPQARMLSSHSSQPPSLNSRETRRKSTFSADDPDNSGGQFSGEEDDQDLGTCRFDSLAGAAAEEAEGDEDAEDRTRRRLAQNREAARKSRQRRKQYVARLEAEVKQLRAQVAQQGKAGVAAGGRMPSASARASLGSPRNGAAAGVPPSGSHAGANTSLSRLSQQGGAAASSPAPGGTAEAPAPVVAAADLGDLGPTDNQAEILAAFARWRQEHAVTARSVREALSRGGSADAALRSLADEARSQLYGLFQMKRAVVYSEGVGLIAGLAHLNPAERPSAWLGSGPLRPSDAAAGLLARLPAAAGPQAAMQLQILKESLAQQEAMLSAGYDAVTGELRARASRADAPPTGVSGAQLQAALARSPWASPEVLGRLDTLRTLLLQADQLWQQFLEETQRVLPLPQAALAAISMAEASAHLQALHGPFLALATRQQAAASAAAATAAQQM